MKDIYNFVLPKELIAQEPARPRDHAKMLVYRLADGSITDDYFYNLPKYLPKNTVLALNNSKVEQCRWLFGPVEIFVLEKLDTNTVRAMVRPGRKFRSGSVVKLAEGLEAEVMAIDDEGVRTLELNQPHDSQLLRQYEHIPLPPYIEQDDSLADEYQTVYAKPIGSLAAPTAGLHFTPKLLDKIRATHPVVEITLHVGLGTFAKLSEENLSSGRLHEEYYEVQSDVAKTILNAPHLTAVGTTTTRTLESFAANPAKLADWTDIFIRPGYKFKAVDSMITNFHLPSTSLLMLVAAFLADKKVLNEQQAATELIRIYEHAIQQKYRFYSFGDAMLLV